MRNLGMVGVGCFAKPETLSRVLKNMIEGYILGNFERITEKNDNNLISTELVQLLKDVIVGSSGSQQAVDGEVIDSLADRKITGFFLRLKNERLNLSLFTRESGLKSKKFSANLDALTQIRKKRLN